MISAVVFAVLFLYKANWAKYEIVKIFLKEKTMDKRYDKKYYFLMLTIHW